MGMDMLKWLGRQIFGTMLEYYIIKSQENWHVPSFLPQYTYTHTHSHLNSKYPRTKKENQNRIVGMWGVEF